MKEYKYAKLNLLLKVLCCKCNKVNIAHNYPPLITGHLIRHYKLLHADPPCRCTVLKTIALLLFFMKSVCWSSTSPSIVSDTDTIVGWIFLVVGMFLNPATLPVVAETFIQATHYMTVTAGLKMANHPHHNWLAVVFPLIEWLGGLVHIASSSWWCQVPLLAVQGLS